MKIGFLIYDSLETLSGGYLYDRKLVEFLRAQEDDVKIISLPWRNYAAHLTDNLWFRLWSPEARFWKTRQPAARLQKFDILIQDELNHPSLIAANQRPHPYPIVSLVHHLRCSELRPKWQNDFYRVAERKYLQSVDGFIFNSQTTQRVVNSLIGNSLPGVIAYPPTDRFGTVISEGEIRGRAANNELKILFLGNVIERKGLQTLLKAVKGQGSRVRVDVIGSLTTDPKYSKQMQDFVTVNGLHLHRTAVGAVQVSSIVHFHGALNKEQLLEKLRQAHVLVVPSSYEGFGIVYLEGMCFGLPAIGTTAGAAGEIIEHEKTGFLIQPNDHQTLATLLARLASDRDLLTKLSLNARKRYTQQPAWNETASQIRAFLQNMIGHQ